MLAIKSSNCLRDNLMILRIEILKGWCTAEILNTFLAKTLRQRLREFHSNEGLACVAALGLGDRWGRGALAVSHW